MNQAMNNNLIDLTIIRQTNTFNESLKTIQKERKKQKKQTETRKRR